MNHSKYLTYQLQDFLEDDYFVQWVIRPDDQSNLFWQSFTAAYPDKNILIKKASAIIQAYREQDFVTNEEQKNKVWQRIQNSVNEVPARRIFRLPVFIRVAAAILLLVVAAFLIIDKHNKETGKAVSYTTGYGEKKIIELPDQSQVTLNANSTLTYNSNPDKNTPREVWIQGEAYFTVKHINKDTSKIAPGDRFIVHGGDINIEVLGTSFNVKARHGKTDVALITGKIRIDYNDESKKSNIMIMAPGDYVQYTGKKIMVNKKLARPAQVTAWTADEIAFTNASLNEIKEMLQDRYGYTVVIKDESLLPLIIEGDISVDKISELLDVVATTLNVTIEQSADKHIAISK